MKTFSLLFPVKLVASTKLYFSCYIVLELETLVNVNYRFTVTLKSGKGVTLLGVIKINGSFNLSV
jgi:hypothetical protein